MLAKAVEKTFHSWHTAKKLDTFYRLKSAVLRDIKKANGGNTCNMRHCIDGTPSARAPTDVTRTDKGSV